MTKTGCTNEGNTAMASGSTVAYGALYSVLAGAAFEEAGHVLWGVGKG